MSRFVMAGLILIFVVIGMTLRLVAFNRADSYAVEMGKASLICYIFKIAVECDSKEAFMQKYMGHLITLFILAYVICIIHRLFCAMCFDGIKDRIEQAKDRMSLLDGENTHEEEGRFLDSVAIISRRSLYISYSRWIDRWLRDFPLTRFFFKNQDADAGCKPGKTELRQSLAEISNYVVEMSVGDKMKHNKIFNEGDFNIPEKAQVIGLLCFQVFPILSVVIALEFL